MVRHAVLMVALIACKQTETAPPTPTPVTAPVAPHMVPVISDEVAMQIGNFGFGMALDFTKIDREMLAGLLPATPACMGSAIRAAKLVALTQTGDSWHAYITGVAKSELDQCVGMFGPDLVVSTKGDLSTITSGSDAPVGGMSATLTDLLHAVPHTAIGWLASSGLPQKNLKTLVGWLEADRSPATTWTFTVRAEATDQATAMKFVTDARDGVIDGFKERGVTADPAWFTTSTTPTGAQLVAKVPLAALARH